MEQIFHFRKKSIYFLEKLKQQKKNCERPLSNKESKTKREKLENLVFKYFKSLYKKKIRRKLFMLFKAMLIMAKSNQITHR